MKKAIKLLSVVCVVALVLACALTANAKVPLSSSDKFTCVGTTTAPVLDGKVDACYGEMQWDVKATEHTVGDYDLFPRSDDLFTPDMVAVRNIMRQQGFMTWDENNFYLAVKCTDTFPKAAEDSNKPWNGTNIQVLFYTGGSDVSGTPGESENYFRSWITLHWGGENLCLYGKDSRSVFDGDKIANTMKVSYDQGTGIIIWEVAIPWDAFVIPGCTPENKRDDFRIAVCQTSMAQGYICNSFGESMSLKYGPAIPVEFKAAPVQESTPVSSETTPVSSETTPVSSETTPVSSDETPDSSAGTDVTSSDSSDVTSSDKTESKDDKTESKDDTKGDVVEEEKDYTAVIVIAIIAAVVIIGGVVAIILINKKKAE